MHLPLPSAGESRVGLGVAAASQDGASRRPGPAARCGRGGGSGTWAWWSSGHVPRAGAGAGGSRPGPGTEQGSARDRGRGLPLAAALGKVPGRHPPSCRMRPAASQGGQGSSPAPGQRLGPSQHPLWARTGGGPRAVPRGQAEPGLGSSEHSLKAWRLLPTGPGEHPPPTPACPIPEGRAPGTHPAPRARTQPHAPSPTHPRPGWRQPPSLVVPCALPPGLPWGRVPWPRVCTAPCTEVAAGAGSAPTPLGDGPSLVLPPPGFPRDTAALLALPSASWGLALALLPQAGKQRQGQAGAPLPRIQPPHHVWMLPVPRIRRGERCPGREVRAPRGRQLPGVSGRSSSSTLLAAAPGCTSTSRGRALPREVLYLLSLIKSAQRGLPLPNRRSDGGQGVRKVTHKKEENCCDVGPTAGTCITPCPGCRGCGNRRAPRQGSRHPGLPNSLCKGWKRQKKREKKTKQKQ